MSSFQNKRISIKVEALDHSILSSNHNKKQATDLRQSSSLFFVIHSIVFLAFLHGEGVIFFTITKENDQVKQCSQYSNPDRIC